MEVRSYTLRYTGADPLTILTEFFLHNMSLKLINPKKNSKMALQKSTRFLSWEWWCGWIGGMEIWILCCLWKRHRRLVTAAASAFWRTTSAYINQVVLNTPTRFLNTLSHSWRKKESSPLLGCGLLWGFPLAKIIGIILFLTTKPFKSHQKPSIDMIQSSFIL